MRYELWDPTPYSHETGRVSMHCKPLNYALWTGLPCVVEDLLNHGFDINATCRFCGNALHAASSQDNVEVVKTLLERGVSINIKGVDFGNAIEAACYGNSVGSVRMLLAKGANPNIEGDQGGGALRLACGKKSVQIVRMLLDSGADVGSKNFLGYPSAFQIALKAGNFQITDMLLEKGAAVVGQTYSDYVSLLESTSSWGDTEAERRMLQSGSDVNAYSDEFSTVLSVASCGSHTQILRALLKSGTRYNRFKTSIPLREASRRGFFEIVQWLVQRGAKVDRKVLKAAQRGHHHEITKFLIEKWDRSS